jgi:AcrR family transcriptional regulator
VNAAVELLEERGSVAAVPLREVAARLGIRTQSLYAHVDGLAGLRRALALRGLDRLADTLASAAIGKAKGDAIEAIVLAYERFAREHPGLYDASLQAPGDDVELIAAVARVTRPLNLVFRSYGLDDSAGADWYRMVFATVHGFVTLRRDGLFTLPGDPDNTLRHIIQLFVHQIEREVTSRGGRRSRR